LEPTVQISGPERLGTKVPKMITRTMNTDAGAGPKSGETTSKAGTAETARVEAE